ncbi:hypothetical protein Ddc_08433 [Ditylenchus destructor]|nr:hypothetical protein Ddc_08433 [Ditylenchus destructor]
MPSSPPSSLTLTPRWCQLFAKFCQIFLLFHVFLLTVPFIDASTGTVFGEWPPAHSVSASDTEATALRKRYSKAELAAMRRSNQNDYFTTSQSFFSREFCNFYSNKINR